MYHSGYINSIPEAEIYILKHNKCKTHIIPNELVHTKPYIMTMNIVVRLYN